MSLGWEEMSERMLLSWRMKIIKPRLAHASRRCLRLTNSGKDGLGAGPLFEPDPRESWFVAWSGITSDHVIMKSGVRRNRSSDWGERIEKWIDACKERGEWVELCFMALAAGMGMYVSKPYGESRRYDVLVEANGRIWRVQVKSTIYRRRGNEYSLNVMGPGRKRYEEGTVDFFAVYLIPADEWYIIPYEALGKRLTLHFAPGGKRQKYAKYREAWHPLTGGAAAGPMRTCRRPRARGRLRASVAS